MNFKKVFKNPTQIAIFDFNTFNAEGGELTYDYKSAIAFGGIAVIAANGEKVNLKASEKKWNDLCKVYPKLADSAHILIADKWVSCTMAMDSYWDGVLDREEDYPF